MRYSAECYGIIEEAAQLRGVTLKDYQKEAVLDLIKLRADMIDFERSGDTRHEVSRHYEKTGYDSALYTVLPLNEYQEIMQVYNTAIKL